MSDVASLGLCRELYELSKWGEKFKEEEVELWGVANNGDASVITQGGLKGFPTEIIPAYTLGYMLRKLPKWHNGNGISLKLDNMKIEPWRCGYPKFWAYANTAEDATAKIAIELFKTGVLKRGT